MYSRAAARQQPRPCSAAREQTYSGTSRLAFVHHTRVAEFLDESLTTLDRFRLTKGQ